MAEQVSGSDGWGDIFKGFIKTAGAAAIETQREKATMNNASASPAVHAQPSKTIQPTGAVAQYNYGPMQWLQENMLTAAFMAFLVILLIVLLIKWA